MIVTVYWYEGSGIDLPDAITFSYFVNVIIHDEMMA